MTRLSLILAVCVGLARAEGADPQNGKFNRNRLSRMGQDGGLIKSVQDKGRTFPTPPRPARARNLQVIGYHDLGGGGFNTDVWAHGNFAYVGTWGAWTSRGTFCPNDDGSLGVKVIDLTDPSDPVLAAILPSPPGTQTNDVKVSAVHTPTFHGDVLVVSNEDCRAADGARGLEMWDVTDPYNPLFLSRFGPEAAQDTEAILVDIGFGVHNTFIFQQGARAYLAVVIDFAEIFQALFGAPVGDGDLRFFDITDPTNPVQVSSWGIAKDLGLDPLAGHEDEAFSAGIHDVWVENDIAYVSYWDSGLILLDVSDPSQPVAISRTTYDPAEEGNTHAAVPAQGGNLVLVSDEDFESGPWGFLRVFDTQDASHPVQVSTFTTDNALLDPPPDAGDYTIHNIDVRGSTAYISWYSDGLRVVDFSAPAAPREIASFVPPDLPDPVGFFPAKALVWGVYVQGDLILISDTNGGLYVLKHAP